MKKVFVALALAGLVTSQAHAAGAELSQDTKRMLAYGTLAVMTGACKTPMTPAQTSKMKNGLEKAAEAQKDLTPDMFTEAMKAVGTQVGENKEQICASLTPEFVDSSLEEAATGD